MKHRHLYFTLMALCCCLSMRGQSHPRAGTASSPGADRTDFATFLQQFPVCREQVMTFPDTSLVARNRADLPDSLAGRFIPRMPEDTLTYSDLDFTPCCRFSLPRCTVMLVRKFKDAHYKKLPGYFESVYCFLSYSPEGRLIDYQEIATDSELYPCRIRLTKEPLVAEVRQCFKIEGSPSDEDRKPIVVMEKRYSLQEDGTFTGMPGEEYRGVYTVDHGKRSWKIFKGTE